MPLAASGIIPLVCSLSSCSFATLGACSACAEQRARQHSLQPLGIEVHTSQACLEKPHGSAHCCAVEGSGCSGCAPWAHVRAESKGGSRATCMGGVRVGEGAHGWCTCAGRWRAWPMDGSCSGRGAAEKKKREQPMLTNLRGWQGLQPTPDSRAATVPFLLRHPTPSKHCYINRKPRPFCVWHHA